MTKGVHRVGTVDFDSRQGQEEERSMSTESTCGRSAGLGLRLFVGPDHKLRFIWRAVIFWGLADYGLPVVFDPLFGS
jgi:hypothetical protein